MGNNLNNGAQPLCAITTTLLAASVLLVLLSVLAFLVPASVPTEKPEAVRHEAAFEYSAAVPSSVVYPDGRVDSGDPVFRRLVDRLDLGATVSVHTPDGATLDRADVALVAEVSADGWSTVVPLAEATTDDQGTARLSAALDLVSIERTVGEAAQLAGLNGSSYQLSLRTEVRGDVVVAGTTVALDAAPSLKVSVDGTDVNIPTDALTVTEDQTLSTKQSEPNSLDAGPLSIPVEPARALAPPAAVGMLVGGALLGIRDRRAARQDPAGIRRLPAARLIATDALQAVGSIVDVTSAEALGRIAEEYDSFIFHGRDRHDAWYVVSDGTTTFRYRVPA